MAKEPHPLIVRQLVVADDLDAGPQERWRREAEESRPSRINTPNAHGSTFSCEAA
jgi:hypothetical protein